MHTEEVSEIRSCHHVIGNSSFIVEADVSSVTHLERLIEQLSRYGQTATSIVVKTPQLGCGVGV